MELEIEEEKKEKIFAKIDSHSIRNTKYHYQRRKSLHYYEPNQLFFKNDEKVSVLHLDSGKIVDNIIPKGLRSELEISVFMKTKNYFLWSYRGDGILYVSHLEDDKVFKTKCYSGYQFNEVDLTKDEKYVFTVGQTRILTMYELAREKGLRLVENQIVQIQSSGNDVRLSPDNKFVAVVTDSARFQVFSFSQTPLPTLSEDIANSDHKSELRTYYGQCDMLDWSKDSIRLVVANDRDVILYNVRTNQIEHRIESRKGVSFCMWSPVREDIFIWANHSINSHLVQVIPNTTEEEEGGKKDDKIPTLKSYALAKEIESTVPEVKNHQIIVSMNFSKNGDRIFGSFETSANSNKQISTNCVLVECALRKKFQLLRMSPEMERQHLEDFRERIEFLFSDDNKEKIYQDGKEGCFKFFVMLSHFNLLEENMGGIAKLFFLSK